MDLSFNHIKSSSFRGDVCVLYVFNHFQFASKSVSLSSLIEADIFNEKYLHYYKGLDGPDDRKIVNNRRYSNCASNGSLLKSDIKESNFQKLSLGEYKSNMNTLIQSWKDDKEDDLYIETIDQYYLHSFQDLDGLNLKEFTFYFFNAPSPSDHEGEFQYRWIYGSFITVVAIGNNSGDVVILNFGDD